MPPLTDPAHPGHPAHAGHDDHQHLPWGAEALWQQLQPLLPGLSVEVVARTASTNTQLLERARESGGRPGARITRPGELDGLKLDNKRDSLGDDGAPHGRRQGDIQPCLLVAEHQTRGRGRLGRDWEASAAASLTFSLSLPLAPADWSGLSLAVGLALAQALEPAAATASSAPAVAAPPRIQLKWPNDLWLADTDTDTDTAAAADKPGGQPGRKLGGILIETVSVGQRRMCVIGVGLNIAPQSYEGLAHGYACLQELDPATTAPAALAQVARPLVQALLQFERQGFAPLVAAYAQRDLLLGRSVTTTLADARGAAIEGVAEGVDQRGALRVRSGALHHVVSGEVSVRLQAPPTAQATQSQSQSQSKSKSKSPGAAP